MDELIRHEGIVLAVQDGKALVEIVQTSACSACKARGMCMSAESQEKRIDAVMLEPMAAGDRVEVMVAEKLAWKAVLLAYILPFVVMVAVIGLLRYRTILHRFILLSRPFAERVFVYGEEDLNYEL